VLVFGTLKTKDQQAKTKHQSMNILIVAATPFEIAPFQNYLDKKGIAEGDFSYQLGKINIKLLITGVGMTHTAYALGKFFSFQKVDLAINAGVAGAFSRDFKLGDVVNVVSEKYGDLGAEDADGSFIDIHEMGLIPGNEFPFLNGQLNHPLFHEIAFLPKANGLTVNKVHGYLPSIETIQKKYKVEVETMEGAAFFQVCLLEKIAFLEIRAISNYVEARNRENWELGLAIGNLNEVLMEILKGLK